MKKLICFLVLSLISIASLSGVDSTVYCKTATASDEQGVAAPASGRYYKLVYVTVTNTSTTDNAEVWLRNGTSTSGTKIMSQITLLPHQSTQRNPGQDSPRITGGVFLDRSNTGTTEICMYIQ